MSSIITDTTALAAVSRGWQLGDGHFTTVHAKHGQLRHWAYHQDRLMAACSRLHMPMPDWSLVKAQALAFIEPTADQVLRITLVRGAGGRGYSLQGCTETQVLLTTAPFPAQYYQWQTQGIAIGVCQGRLGSSPLLAGLKTLNRLEQVLLKAELDAQHWPEALVLDTQYRVVEAVTANVFWREGAIIYTPDLRELGVWGTMRAWCADYLGARLMHTAALLPRLLAADEVWLTNALMGVVPVLSIALRADDDTNTNTLDTHTLDPNTFDVNTREFKTIGSKSTDLKVAEFKVTDLKITRELQQAYEKTN